MAVDIGLRHAIGYVLTNPLLLVGGFCLYLALYLISIVFFGKKKGKNPFARDHRRPHEPFVHDAKARDAILKQKFKPGKVPEGIDVIIVGSGAGGLVAGVLLSRTGKTVLVLEQHDQAGGCCHSFVDKGFEFDTGIHYVGNLHDGSVDRTLLDSVTCGQLRWAKMDDAFDMVALGPPSSARKYPMASGKERYIQNLIDMFPKEEKAIREYMRLILDAGDSFLGIVMLKVLPKPLVRFVVMTGLYKLVFKCYRKAYVTITLQEVLDKLTNDMELKAVLSYICGDYGVLPAEVPFILHAILIKHYLSGAYYPMGGTSEVAFYMTQVIQKAGGRVLVQAPVSQIICNDQGKAVGVSVTVGKETVDLSANIIISDAGAVNTFKTLLPEHVAKKSCIYPLIDKVGPSCSFITTFIGVDGDQEELKLPAGNVWAFQSNDLNKTMAEYMDMNTDDLEELLSVPLYYISFPTAKDPEFNKKYPGKSTVLVITLARWECFKEWKEDKHKHRGSRYEGIKDVIGRNMWQTCVELYPQLEGKMVYMDVGTPVTNQHYLACPEGEMYGLHQGKRFDIEAVTNLRCDTDIPGLYLTGQDTLTCGFTPAILSGLFTTSHILGRNCYNDLLKLQKDIKIIDAKNGGTKKKD